MDKGTIISEQLVAWGAAARPLPGQSVSGDQHIIKSFGHRVLLAVVDGIGHGREATAAAKCAIRTLEAHAAELPVKLVQRCHAALRASRGVVMTLASLDATEGTLAWLGVGNVEAHLIRAAANARPATERVLLRNGLVGYKLPELQASIIPIQSGDLFVFATDGIAPGFLNGWMASAAPQQIADQIMERHFKGNDDALALVVRYLGSIHD